MIAFGAVASKMTETETTVPKNMNVYENQGHMSPSSAETHGSNESRDTNGAAHRRIVRALQAIVFDGLGRHTEA